MRNPSLQPYQSSEDENYEPTQKQHKEYESEHHRARKSRHLSSNFIHQLYLDMLKEVQEMELKTIEKKEEDIVNRVQLASNILNSQSIKPNKRLIFAGKQYILNQQTGQLQAIQRKIPHSPFPLSYHLLDHQTLEIRNRHIAYQYLNHVMQAIYNRSKKINAIGKSKLDWKGFVKQEGIEDKLHYNRKGGVIQNMQFLRNSK